MGALTHNGEVLQGLPADASQINFDKTGTDLNSTQTENAIKEVNTKANTLQSEKADTDMVAADFNAGTSYTAGNYCVQDGKLYKFKVNHSGAWSAADVDEIKIAGELSALKSGLTYHKVGESEATGTYADKLQSLNTVYSSLSLAQKLSAVLVLNGNDFYYPTNASGVFHTTFVASNTTLHVCVSIAGTFYVNTDGTTSDSSATENASVFSIWVAN